MPLRNCSYQYASLSVMKVNSFLLSKQHLPVHHAVFFIPRLHITYLLHGAESFIRSFSASQEIPRILWNSMVHCSIYKCPPPVSFLSQIKLVHAPPHPTFLRSILKLSSHLRLGLPSGLFPSGFPAKTLYTPHLPIMLNARPSHSRFDHPNNIW